MTAPLVVLTGAARGQGAAHAELLVGRGYAVLVADVRDEEGEATARGLRAVGADATYRHLDVTSEADWSALAADIRTSGASLRGLVNNAGILRHHVIAETSVDEWEQQFAVNARSAFLGIRALAPLMADGGSIVNVSSTAALVGATGYAAYSASKAALLGLTRAAAVELAPRVRVNAICPGGVATAMNDDEPAGGSSSAAPLGRRARVDEISPLVAYLISDDAAFMTGSALTIDGGLTAA
ncbi:MULTISPECIES: SDR family NAD(P)-dependent oxidoreductase [Microbacterium]|uniref:SDR family NAD(P)-dependent oxidoreductase n=1 Tax=Microbacterium TaxID=33882 RepID=UPI00277F87C7|nr:MULTISPECIES: SDR family oxidoreductase [Microbacterium]MDQ1084802.1 3alpha(or 20beta)-hydroxysteroid dehydrogenase [Microbacterium sp. SORGH_AS_0344]MDQ1169919.1 3alpha(or 20beta)-hydroxysteroid dehydrogenase [Microbacterium proteolyticum]